MDRNFFTELLNHSSGEAISLTDTLTGIILTFILALLITTIYRKTHHGVNYSQSFVHTVIIMSVVVSVVMAVIGNNIAVAFGLVGAFSIIRFRSAMGDPKDIAYIFFGMAAGVANGLGYYVVAVLFTIFVCIFIYILFILDYGKRTSLEKRLKITIPENLHYEELFDDIFKEHLEEYRLESVETTNLGTMLLLDYTIRSRVDSVDKDLIDAIREKNANLKVTLNMAKVTF